MGYVFISYSSKNASHAEAMKRLLSRNGIETWMAPGDIPAGSKYAQVIARAVRDCACFLLLLSEDSQNSMWVAKEVERAISNKKTIIPVKIEELEVNEVFEMYISDDQLVTVQAIDENAPGMDRILEGIYANTHKKVSEDLVIKEAASDDVKILSVGEIVRFGSYHHYDEYDKEPLEWIVTDIKGGRVVLLSRYIIDAMPFNEDTSTNLWKDCTLRKWLSGDFYENAFSKAEKEALIKSTLFTERSGGTADIVYLPTREDVVKYFPADNARSCTATDYAKINGAYASLNPGSSFCGNSCWWLRTSSSNPSHGTYVNFDGNARNYAYVMDETVGVRPAVTVDISYFE